MKHRFTAKKIDDDEMEAECSCGQWSAGTVGDLGGMGESNTRAMLREVWRDHRDRAV